MAFRWTRTYRSLLRLTDIATVLTRHGLGHLVDQLGLRQHVPFLRTLSWRLAGREAALPVEHLGQRIVLVLQDLGPTFIKLGQQLASRPDILPEAWLPEFRRLQDRVPPFDAELAGRAVAEALGRPLDEAFARFDVMALASGSIAQAHSAALPDGTEVIVKIRRPGIDAQLLVDLELLQDLAELAERYIEELRAIQPTTIVGELARGLRRELDFVTEATATAKFHAQYAQRAGIRTPRVYWDWVRPTVLVVEKLPGRNIGDFERLSRLGLDRSALAEALAGWFVEQYFVTGLFHADPHPGNILVDESGVVGLIDFGAVGQLPGAFREQLSSGFLAVARGDLDLVVRIVADVCEFHAAADLAAVERDLLELLDRYFGTPLDVIDTGRVFSDLARVARSHGVVLPRELVLLGKSLAMVTALCRELDPRFTLARAVEPQLWPLLREKLSPGRWLGMATRMAWTASSLAEQLPDDAKTLLGQLRRGELRQLRRLEGLEVLSRAIEHAASRLALAAFLGSLVVASSLLANQQGGASTLAIAGYLAGAVVGLWLVIDVLRSGAGPRPR